MTPRVKAALDKKLREGIEAILKNYPNGRVYDRDELLSDVRHDLDLLIKKLNLKKDTPLKVFLDEGILCISLGRFPDRN